MAGRIPERFIDDLLTRIDIVDVIQERVTLKKAGRDWSARCPFHDERSPSFTVSPAKQFYHCFGCGAHGSAIRFLMDYDRLEFPDAIEELAARAGLKVEYEGGQRQAPREDAGDLYTLLDAAATFYREQLARSPAAREYFERRGLDDDTLKRFNLGFAPNQWDALKSALGTNPQRVALLDKAGMLASGDRGNQYDRFRDRVMFPILDRRGRTIAFGGRVMGKDDGPKYLNSPETPLFHKGRELFGLWQVRDANQKIGRLLVVEGYMDVIALHQYGITQAVATLGTATTSDHAEILFRNSPDVYFCFDGDRAGRQAAWRAVESVLPRMRDGRQAWFLFVPDGEDPDSLIRAEGVDGFEQRLKQATPLSEFFFAETGKDVNLASIDGKARLAERARPLIGQIPDGAFRDLMYVELERLSGAKTAQPASMRSASSGSHRGNRPAQRSLVRTAVALLVQTPSLASEIEPPWLFSELRQAGIPLLVELIGLCRERPSLTTGALLEQFSERDEATALNKLATMDLLVDPGQARADFLGALAQLDVQTSQQRLDDLIARQIEGGLSEQEREELRHLMVNKPAHRRQQ
ncbi:MAG: DNA primase [Xanthomonadales bacterium]|nr:DNA primase [Xanthomonadales bacterium]